MTGETTSAAAAFESARPATGQAEAAYRRLRAAVLELELRPGDRVSERGLETLAGASRTPVRAAMVRLEAQGLLRRDGRGWIVAPLDRDELDQAAEFREAVEAAAVRLAVGRVPASELATLHALVDGAPGDPDELLGASRSFHSRLAAAGGNRFLADAVAAALARLERARWLEVRTAESRERSAAEHRAILAAVQSGDADEAERLVREHARAARERTAAALAPDRTRGLHVT
ncbi:GntR family transcriptional regulator [Schumannella soli]|uniref:GntR family transcriptional regulator n=1 Tax=Schumannella soli TaxID=2590779 RepID=UPI0021033176|nr:GntR family transcriptional regulator [Schumannella soli]